jgi:hypothetical protein
MSESTKKMASTRSGSGLTNDIVEAVTSNILFGKQSLKESQKYIKSRSGPGVASSRQLIRCFETLDLKQQANYVEFVLNQCLFQVDTNNNNNSNNLKSDKFDRMKNRDELMTELKKSIDSMEPCFENVAGWEELSTKLEVVLVTKFFEMSSTLHEIIDPRLPPSPFQKHICVYVYVHICKTFFEQQLNSVYICMADTHPIINSLISKHCSLPIFITTYYR